MMKEPPWVELARKEIGVKEVAGAADSPAIVAYAKAAGLVGAAWSEDETSRCASFVGAMLARSGFTPTKSGLAKSWSRWLEGVRLGGPVLGAVTVIERSPKVEALGHVFFLIGRDAEYLYGLGGNQSDQVSIARFARSRLHSMWWPKGSMIDPLWIAPGRPMGWTEGGKVS